jgi:DNA-binding NtrC family response regulator
MLVESFLDRFARKAGKKIRRIKKTTMDRLLSYPWPGNVRELQNVIERSLIVCETEDFTVDESWLAGRSDPTSKMHRPQSQMLSTRINEKEIIEAALAETGGRVSGPSGAAAKLNMPASTLDYKVRALKINKYRFK